MSKKLLKQDKIIIDKMIARANKAVEILNSYTQEELDKLCQFIAWNISNETTFKRLAQAGVDESGIGNREERVGKRFKVHGILRDCLRQKSRGIIENNSEKGIVKYAKPVGVIASLVPMTNPALTPASTSVYSTKSGNAVIFTPHPRTTKTTIKTVQVLRQACKNFGAPEDLFQIIEKPSIPKTNYLMEVCDLTMATGGPTMVKAAYSSGKPAYGVGAGNSTMVIDETADINIAAANTRMSKTSDFGSGCSADGNIIIQKSIYADMIKALEDEGGYLCNDEEKFFIEKIMWDKNGFRTFDTIACKPQQIAKVAGFKISEDRKFLMVENQGKIGKKYQFSKEKLTTLMALYYFETFDDALEMVSGIYETGGKGHSCGIYSHNDENIDALAKLAPVSRIMVRQAQSKANAGSFTNGMPMTSSLGCGVWGGNITNENISLKHFLNITWVSRPINEDKPSEEELFGEFYNSEVN